MTQSGTAGHGGGGGAGKALPQDFHFTKRLDKASPVLFINCTIGKHFKVATLTARKAGEGQQEYLTVKMEDVLVSSYQFGGSSGGDVIPTDQVSLNFAKLGDHLQGAEAGRLARRRGEAEVRLLGKQEDLTGGPGGKVSCGDCRHVPQGARRHRRSR